MARTKVMDELQCSNCGRKLSVKHSLYETAWSGVYWCGRDKCAIEIMTEECSADELDPNDNCNREDTY